MNRILSTAVVGLVAATVSGCITSPYHETVYSSYNTNRVLTFEGYLDEPGEEVSLQAYVDGSWEEFATAESASSGLPMGWTNVPVLYKWRVSTSVGESGEFWDRNETVRIRVQRESGFDLMGFNRWSEVNCITTTGGRIEDAYSDCVDSALTEIHLIDVD
jgi:hypothetical protein